MSYLVTRYPSPISLEKKRSISKRYHVVTRAINRKFWKLDSDSTHSFYVGSYGRGTAIDTSDIDILIELPLEEYDKFNSIYGNGQSRLLNAVRTALKEVYPRSDIRADGQIIKINFHDGIQFELLPAFKQEYNWGSSFGYVYPDSNMGGTWKSTNPKTEQEAMKIKNSTDSSNGLLYATCKHLRFIRDTHFRSYKLSGIVIDSFVYMAMENWKYSEPGTGSSSVGDYEKKLLDYYSLNTIFGMNLRSPGITNQSMLLIV